MSKEIKITIVMGVEKTNSENEQNKEETQVVTHDISVTLMSTLQNKKLISGSFCGGRGDCGRCRVQFLTGATIPTPMERNRFSPDELRQGYRLACLARPKDDCVIRIACKEEAPTVILSKAIDLSEKNDQISQQKKQTGYRESDVTKTNYLVAVDLGTTTIAMKLVSLKFGETVDIYCEMNPQRSYGADVLSRIQASCDGHGAELQTMVQEVLERGLAKFRATLSGSPERSGAGEGARLEEPDLIQCMCIAGNTTMEHLLMGYDVSGLGASPFVPKEIGIQEYRFADIPVYLAPGISAFVGGDIVAGLYYLGLVDDGARHGLSGFSDSDGIEDVSQGRAALFIDLGTNGEMALTDGERMLVTATAAGPAFEGGAGAGIIGTDMIAAAAALLQYGILDETGLLREPYFTEGVNVRLSDGQAKTNDSALYLKNKDIRALQMAKAAVRAGIEILWERLGRPYINKVYLAGGFGYYLDVDAALRIGLLPERMRGRVKAVGNTSLAGAYRMGKALYERTLNRDALMRRLSAAESVNLAGEESFECLYLQYMNLQPN